MFYPAVDSKGSDYYGVSNSSLIPLARDTYSEIERIRERYDGQLPPTARQALDEFLKSEEKLFKGASGLAGVGATIVALTVVTTRVTVLLADREMRGRSITERAFAHLQRQLVADEDFRSKWQRALSAGETACEALGGVHLLLHGIYAFKVSAKGERTDLVFGEPLELGEAARTAASALVLTEWKVAGSPEEVEQRLEEARRQASFYAAGSLSDLELTSTRFVVVVTERSRDVVPEIRDGDLVYRQIVLAVAPATPSVAARSGGQRGEGKSPA